MIHQSCGARVTVRPQRVWSTATTFGVLYLIAAALLGTATLNAELVDREKLPVYIRSYSEWRSFPNLIVTVTDDQCYIPPKLSEYAGHAQEPKGPHADRRLSVFINPIGARVVKDLRQEKFPSGSVIVKEKKSRSGSPAHAVGVMLKREQGYDSSVGDWEFMYLGAGEALIRGKEHTQSCADCHLGAASTDYVFGNYIVPGEGYVEVPKGSLRDSKGTE